MPLVSVIIPYYKKKPFFEKTLKSVISQTLKDFEIIIIYNDTDEDEIKFVKKLIKKKKKIKLFIKRKKLGAGLARNFGIEKSQGKYIAFLDADDIWKKNKLKLQMNFMKVNKFEISHTSYEAIKKEKKIVIKSKSFQNYKDLLKSCDIGLSTVILKRKILNKYFSFSNLKTKEDFVLWLKLLKYGYKIEYLDKNLTQWRKVKNSLSSSNIQKIKDGFKVFNYHMNFNFLKSLYYLFILSLNSLKK
jgi:teichuronic acid biosynthesis glycosyltransferase TuaG